MVSKGFCVHYLLAFFFSKMVQKQYSTSGIASKAVPRIGRERSLAMVWHRAGASSERIMEMNVTSGFFVGKKGEQPKKKQEQARMMGRECKDL